jgi:hypothetical protein
MRGGMLGLLVLLLGCAPGLQVVSHGKDADGTDL